MFIECPKQKPLDPYDPLCMPTLGRDGISTIEDSFRPGNNDHDSNVLKEIRRRSSQIISGIFSRFSKVDDGPDCPDVHNPVLYNDYSEYRMGNGLKGSKIRGKVL